jgi:hypothetical protein
MIWWQWQTQLIAIQAHPNPSYTQHPSCTQTPPPNTPSGPRVRQQTCRNAFGKVKKSVSSTTRVSYLISLNILTFTNPNSVLIGSLNRGRAAGYPGRYLIHWRGSKGEGYLSLSTKCSWIHDAMPLPRWNRFVVLDFPSRICTRAGVHDLMMDRQILAISWSDDGP